MRRANILTIFRREVRDQVRDRRTLFMIFVLPMLLYPVLMIGSLRLAEAFEQKPGLVVIVGAENLPAEPPLLTPDRSGFDPSLFDRPEEAARLVVRAVPADSSWADPVWRERALRRGEAEAVVLIPGDVKRDLEELARARIPIAYNGADEKSSQTNQRVREALAGWREAIVRHRLQHDGKPIAYVKPLQAERVDVATRSEIGGGVWARLFPFLLVMMALTGAFYPAIDLCAGEKERGTMETLLISPASRFEIVLGKFLTVMLASMATAILNIASMTLTAAHLARGLGQAVGGGGFGRPAGGPAPVLELEPPGLASIAWMLVLLVPLSAFFAAVCMALAVLARSMKEGQYYMTPLYLVAIPLVFLTLAPGVELNAFTSLIPITGASLLLRALMQGHYDVAGRFSMAVVVPLIVYSWLALRWAIEQFRNESVLFREAERFDLVGWAIHLVRDRPPVPDGGQALLCFVLMLVSAWGVLPFMAGSLTGMVLGQVGIILAPAVLMALLLTANPARTLKLRWPRGRYLAVAAALAVVAFPLIGELRVWVEWLFPAPESVKALTGELLSKIPNLATGILVLALVPAICEEVAFRGFILSGFQGEHRQRSAIVISAFLFGFMHVLLSLFQQLFNATLLGLVLGLLAVRSHSLLPGIVFHFLNNAQAVLLGEVTTQTRWRPLATMLFRDRARGLYDRGWLTLSALATTALLTWLYFDGKAARKPAVEPLAEVVEGTSR